MKTLLVNFTESEKQGRKFIYTDYENVVVYLDDENTKQVYIEEVGHKKNLSSLLIVEEANGRKTKEEMVKLHQRNVRKVQIAKEKKLEETKRGIRETLGLKRFEKKHSSLIDVFNYFSNIKNGIEIFKEIAKFENVNKSPYSMSFYNEEVDWNYKPQGSLRISDHWNFYSEGEKHCELEETSEYTQKWLMCEFRNGKYHILKEF